MVLPYAATVRKRLAPSRSTRKRMGLPFSRLATASLSCSRLLAGWRFTSTMTSPRSKPASAAGLNGETEGWLGLGLGGGLAALLGLEGLDPRAQLDGLALADHADRHFAPHARLGNRARKISHPIDGAAVVHGDDVARLQAGAAGGRAGRHRGDQHALGVWTIEALGQVRRDRLYGDAEPAPRDRAGIGELGDHGLGQAHGNGEADAHRAPALAE